MAIYGSFHTAPHIFYHPSKSQVRRCHPDFQMKELISELGGTKDRNSPDSQVRFRKPVFLRGNRTVSWEKILGLYHSSLAGPCLPHHWKNGVRDSNTKVRSRDRNTDAPSLICTRCLHVCKCCTAPQNV